MALALGRDLAVGGLWGRAVAAVRAMWTRTAVNDHQASSLHEEKQISMVVPIHEWQIKDSKGCALRLIYNACNARRLGSGESMNCN